MTAVTELHEPSDADQVKRKAGWDGSQDDLPWYFLLDCTQG